jgi:hypothetical protein
MSIRLSYLFMVFQQLLTDLQIKESVQNGNGAEVSDSPTHIPTAAAAMCSIVVVEL